MVTVVLIRKITTHLKSQHYYRKSLLVCSAVSSVQLDNIAVTFTGPDRFEPKSMTRTDRDRQSCKRSSVYFSQQARSKPGDQSLRQTNPTRGKKGIQDPESR